MKISLSQEQRPVLGQKMQMSMQLLQMNAMELDTHLRNLALENPLIDIKPPESGIECSLRAVPTGSRSKSKQDGDAPEFLRPAQNYESLRDSIREQIAGLRVPEMMRRELSYLSGEMDERGYLPPDCIQPSIFCSSRERYENAVKVFQSLEPAGVGARSLSECLCIQLRRKGCEDDLPYTICGGYLDRLAKGQLNHISKALGVPIRRVAEAKEIIAGLEPRPSNGFSDGEEIPYVLPDVEIIEREEGFTLVTADKYLPTCTIDAYYSEMAESERLSDEEREYFREKLAQAKWAIDCVRRRRDTLVSCAEAIVRAQSRFFRDGHSPLRPLTMTALAETLGVNVSTVSRAVNGKYLLCRWGTFPFSDFFAPEIHSGNGGTSFDAISEIKTIIADENTGKPFSDRKIAEMLAQKGLKVSRRTIAKYREREMIPPASARRSGRR
ncbi:MAG TPA: RNA polymerase sigma-54 factor [Clostridiales bacterium]|nr:RNA polymerase sigma-54 factor [Clostridiales bacterium]